VHKEIRVIKESKGHKAGKVSRGQTEYRAIRERLDNREIRAGKE